MFEQYFMYEGCQMQRRVQYNTEGNNSFQILEFLKEKENAE